MRAAGIPHNLIINYIDDIMRAARPGFKTIRCGKGKSILLGGLPAAVALNVLLDCNTCQAAEIRNCPTGDCICDEIEYVDARPSPWNIFYEIDTPPGITISTSNLGHMDSDQCASSGGTVSETVSENQVTGFTIVTVHAVSCSIRNPTGNIKK